MIVQYEGEIDMGEGYPSVVWRRVKTREGGTALVVSTSGHISAHGSSVNTMLITTSQEYLLEPPELRRAL